MCIIQWKRRCCARRRCHDHRVNPTRPYRVVGHRGARSRNIRRLKRHLPVVEARRASKRPALVDPHPNRPLRMRRTPLAVKLVATTRSKHSRLGSSLRPSAFSGRQESVTSNCAKNEAGRGKRSPQSRKTDHLAAGVIRDVRRSSTGERRNCGRPPWPGAMMEV